MKTNMVLALEKNKMILRWFIVVALIIFPGLSGAENKPRKADPSPSQISSPVPVKNSSGSIVRYRDERGAVHYVDNINKVPEQFRSSVDAEHKLPNITRGASIDRPAAAKPKEASKSATHSSKKVQILVADWCGYCTALEKFLKSEKIQYTKYDIERNAIGRRRHQELGGGGVPIVLVGSQVIHGFDPFAIKQALGKK